MKQLHVTAKEIRRYDLLPDLGGVVYHVEPLLRHGKILVRVDLDNGRPIERILDADAEITVERDGIPAALTAADAAALLGLSLFPHTSEA